MRPKRFVPRRRWRFRKLVRQAGGPPSETTRSMVMHGDTGTSWRRYTFMLRPIVKTVVHKGFDLPTISWEGDPARVLRAREISLRIALARSDQHSRSAAASDRAHQAIERSIAACSEMHTLYAECDLTPA